MKMRLKFSLTQLQPDKPFYEGGTVVIFPINVQSCHQVDLITVHLFSDFTSTFTSNTLSGEVESLLGAIV